MIRIFILLLLLTTACVSKSPNGSRFPAQANGELTKVDDEILQDFPEISYFRPIKFVFYITNGKPDRLVVIDPRVHAFHYQYLATTSEFKNAGFKDIQDISHKKANRRVILGVMLAGGMFTDEGNWDFRTPYQLTTDEIPEIADLKIISQKLHDWVKSASGDEPLSNLYPNMAYKPLEDHKAQVKEKIENYIKAGVEVKMELETGKVQTYSVGWGVGQLKAFATADEVTAGVANGTITKDSVLLVNGDVLELPPVAGIISARPLTEASHLVLLAQMYGIPLVYQKDAFDRMKTLDGKLVFLQTNLGISDYYSFVAPLSDVQVKALQKVRPASLLKELKADFKTNAILPVDKIADSQVAAYGGKATKFGLIRRTIPNYTKAMAYGVPIHYYKRFLEESVTKDGKKLSVAVNEALSTLAKDPSYSEVVAKANEVQKIMKDSKVSDKLISDIRGAFMAFYKSKGEVRLKIRSSSNVEDGAEFNGAGLYESEGVCLANCKKKDDFAKGLVKVWSSLYSAKGLWARKQFKVPESEVGMGFAVHTPYKGELNNGVVRFRIKKNSSNESERHCEVLGVIGEEDSITNTETGGGNERTFLVNEDIWEIRPLKGFPDGRTMMKNTHYATLCKQMHNLHKAWPQTLNELEIESEWKLMQDGSNELINIKQVRVVPQPKLFNLEKNQVLLIMPTQWVLKGELSESIVGAQYNADYATFTTNTFSFDDFKKGKLKVSDFVYVLNGKKFPMKIGTPKLKIGKITAGDEAGKIYSYDIAMSLTSNELPKMDLIFSINTYTPSSVITQENISISTTYTSFNSPYNYVGGMIYDKNNKTFPPEYAEFSPTCPVRISWKSSERYVGSDKEIRKPEDMKIDGIIKRTISIAKAPWYMYSLRMHEVIDEQFIDLFLDATLTDKEKKEIEKKGGRYLHTESFLSMVRLKKSETDVGKDIEGCESSSFEEGDAE